MTAHNSNELAKALTTNGVDGFNVGGKVRLFRNTITLDSQASGDTINLLPLPTTGVIVGILVSGTSLGTSTVKVGDASDDDGYIASGTITAGALKFVATEAYIPCGGKKPVLTIGTAAFPSSGAFRIDFLVADNT